MPVLLTRRFTLLLVLAAVWLTVLACPLAQAPPPPPKPKPPDVFCQHGNGSKSFPMICVDDQTLTGDPSPAHVFDVESDKGHPSNRAVVIRWSAKRTADLNITFTSGACTEPVVCNRIGECWARVKPLDPPAHPGEKPKSRPCTYHITISGKPDPDGGLVVDPCCWSN